MSANDQFLYPAEVIGMDVQLLQPYVTSIKDIVLSLAALVAAVVGVIGLFTWRNQLHGETKYKVAKDALISVYELRDAIAEIRRPYTFHWAYWVKPRLSPDDSEKLSKLEAWWLRFDQNYKTLWARVSAASKTLDLNLVEAEVVLSDRAIRHKVNKLYELRDSLRAAMEEQVKQANPLQQHPEENVFKLIARTRILREGSEKNNFDEQLKTLIDDIENVLRPHLMRGR